VTKGIKPASGAGKSMDTASVTNLGDTALQDTAQLKNYQLEASGLQVKTPLRLRRQSRKQQLEATGWNHPVYESG